MEIIGHVRNGVVVLDGSATLPEGLEVRVLTNGQVKSKPEEKELIVLTNEMINKVLDDEEIENYKRVFGLK